ncbi:MULTISPECIES: bifunctional pyr operon transcriptional regulator/uracil phosphoribosyltransferase PyrR [Limnobacter]|uniref:Bifunctional pyr operon transcriptional regulator/uracil phosphoribosyltransferase n=1 Tax=Limnobacter litoralis TaxID=481366 RepID=A0ABQ5YKA2_9BURK|nr:MULTISPECIES: bifunctional pyr operon transcriptional regulator/uracil phosphoribosyltransferase PyrR [Limnobacter]GLR24965.1 bifunctional pyr operon transcriptional regulator/uracil phosphoribosyltransferase [Limnobacter litoralis]HEX5487429.1 bifunctional pyr operon transcriptional regulator/uracil phosphoribosyltransferase PyrR [Limnobacter sp.]
MNLPNPEVLYARLRDQIAKAFPDRSELGLIGVHSGGAWIAERLHRDLNFTLPCGFLDSAFYRDDFSERGLKQDPKPAEVPFDVNGRQILLVDDVLYTGRTTRAIVNHLFDFGRPSKIELAVLLDRGGRELPIDAQYVGKHEPLNPNQAFVLTLDDQGAFQLGLEEN